MYHGFSMRSACRKILLFGSRFLLGIGAMRMMASLLSYDCNSGVGSILYDFTPGGGFSSCYLHLP